MPGSTAHRAAETILSALKGSLVDALDRVIREAIAVALWGERAISKPIAVKAAPKASAPEASAPGTGPDTVRSMGDASDSAGTWSSAEWKAWRAGQRARAEGELCRPPAGSHNGELAWLMGWAQADQRMEDEARIRRLERALTEARAAQRATERAVERLVEQRDELRAVVRKGLAALPERELLAAVERRWPDIGAAIRARRADPGVSVAVCAVRGSTLARGDAPASHRAGAARQVREQTMPLEGMVHGALGGG